ncbi:hypothetical protein BSU04_32700 [Caballeronia sordidicola]|uniref:Uncharacterized protein n=1 Tax=Caballeronia sordidicola TaxID=196367 RepID=A0A226WU66_CABSO|nr:hypothetical protein BSU04_32700 [Caballeronia sordidicola]
MFANAIDMFCAAFHFKRGARCGYTCGLPAMQVTQANVRPEIRVI